MTILDPPNECQEIPGYILVITPDKEWLMQTGQVTTVWEQRGVWATAEEAEKARVAFTEE